MRSTQLLPSVILLAATLLFDERLFKGTLQHLKMLKLLAVGKKMSGWTSSCPHVS